jgi:propionate CoA-transferase
VNVSRLTAQPHVLAGAGGVINIAQGTRRLLYCGTLTAGGLDIQLEDGRLRILREGRFPKFVARTQHVTFNGPLGAKRAQEVWYITERAVFRLTADGLLLTEVAPGIDVEGEIRARIGFPLRLAPDVQPMDARLFRDAPMELGAAWTDGTGNC